MLVTVKVDVLELSWVPSCGAADTLWPMTNGARPTMSAATTSAIALAAAVDFVRLNRSSVIRPSSSCVGKPIEGNQAR